MLTWYSLLIFILPVTAQQDHQQTLLATVGQNTQPAKVAIIGAGIAGASAAYRLREYASPTQYEVHMYERSPQSGGRIKAIAVPAGNDQQLVEIDAHQFYADDTCVQNLIDETGLRRKIEDCSTPTSSVGIWDGVKIVIRSQSHLTPRSWTDWARLAWQYGFSINRVKIWLARAMPSYQKLLGRWQYIYRPIASEIDDLGLTPEFENSAEDVLRNLTSTRYIEDVAQPVIRAQVGQDSNHARGLAAIYALNPVNKQTIPHGRMRSLVDRLIKLSDAQLHLNTGVTKIQRSPIPQQYRLTFGDPVNDEKAPYADYDSIIIAAPIHQANINFDIDHYIQPSTANDYSTRHITLFTSISRLSPTYFNLSNESELPPTIFTTIPSKSQEPPFLSIERSSIPAGRDGCVVTTQNLYRVLSKAPLNDAIILALLGHDGSNSHKDAGLTWTHREVWEDSVLEYDGQPVLDKMEIADGIFYAGMGDRLVGSLDMSCRVGERAATLLVYGIETELEP